MARLIVLNGPPGCGKSTLARRFAEDHPLALALDLDVLRGLIGGWRDQPREAGLLTRAAGLAAAGAHLSAGHDVVVPQYLGRPEFLASAEELAVRCGAGFAEVVLMDSKENALRRFAARGTADPAHREAAELQARTGGDTELAAMYDRLLAVIASRPATRIVPTRHGHPGEAYATFLAVLG